MKKMKHSIEEKNKKLFKKIAGKYDRGFIGKILNKRSHKVLKLAKVKSNSIVLDVGCGTGTFLYLLSKDKSLKLHGLDLSKEMLEIATNKLKDKAILKLGSANNISKYYKKNYFDYIFIDDAFHHLPHQERVIENIKLLLKEDGKIVINDLSFGRFGNFIFHKLEPGNSGMYTPKGYLRLLKGKGFRDIKQKRLSLISVYTEGEK